MVAWLAHAMMAAGCREMGDLDGFEAYVRKGMGKGEWWERWEGAGADGEAEGLERWELGRKLREWWGVVRGRESVRRVFPTPH